MYALYVVYVCYARVNECTVCYKWNVCRVGSVCLYVVYVCVYARTGGMYGTHDLYAMLRYAWMLCMLCMLCRLCCVCMLRYLMLCYVCMRCMYASMCVCYVCKYLMGVEYVCLYVS